MPEEVTDASVISTDTQEKTANATNQEPELAKKLSEYESQINKLAEVEKKAKALETDLRTSQAETLRQQAAYRGLQRQTTQAMQAAAEDRRRLAQLEQERQTYLAALGEISTVKDMVSALATQSLDEDAAKSFNLSQRELAVRRQEEIARLRQQQQAPVTQQPAQYQPYVDPEEQRRQFLDMYFPGSGVDPSDPNIDWAVDAQDPQSAMSRFTSSVADILRNSGQTPAQEEIPQQTETEKLLEEVRREMAAAQTKALEDIRAEAKRETEERLRRMGIDTEPVAGQTASSPQIMTRLNELDDASMMSGHGDVAARKLAQKQYQAKLDEVARELRSRYQ